MSATRSWKNLISSAAVLCTLVALVLLLPSGMSPAARVAAVILVIFGMLAVVMSSVTSNTATANLILPIAMGLSVSNVTPIMIGVAFACSLAMPLPISTPPNAMAFGLGELTTVDMLKPGLLITNLGTVLAFTTGYWWWDIVGSL